MKTSIVIISKDEPLLADTLATLHDRSENRVDEVIVVDSSSGRLDAIRTAHPWVEWIDFVQPTGVRVTIAHQRNEGVLHSRGDIVVFIDCGCIPQSGWLARLLAPIINDDESVTCGPATAQGTNVYGGSRWAADDVKYVDKAPTINLAFQRSAYDAVGGFDERFEYGSDIDFTWRLISAGFRLRWVGDAVVEHEWGTVRRQARRAYAYGAASARLYRKHPRKIIPSLRSNPVPLVYPLFLLGLPITAKYRAYPLLALVPLWRNRRADAPLLVVADHVVHGAGVLAEITGLRT